MEQIQLSEMGKTNIMFAIGARIDRKLLFSNRQETLVDVAVKIATDLIIGKLFVKMNDKFPEIGKGGGGDLMDGIEFLQHLAQVMLYWVYVPPPGITVYFIPNARMIRYPTILDEEKMEMSWVSASFDNLYPDTKLTEEQQRFFLVTSFEHFAGEGSITFK